MNPLKFKCPFCLFLSNLELVLLSAAVKRFSVPHMRDLKKNKQFYPKYILIYSRKKERWQSIFGVFLDVFKNVSYSAMKNKDWFTNNSIEETV